MSYIKGKTHKPQIKLWCDEIKLFLSVNTLSLICFISLLQTVRNEVQKYMYSNEDSEELLDITNFYGKLNDSNC